MKIAVATSQYWPVPGNRQNSVKRFVDRLTACGATVKVLTESIGDHWPKNLIIGDHQVQRFGAGGWNLFGQPTLGKRIVQWLTDNPSDWQSLVLFGVFDGSSICAQHSLQTEKKITWWVPYPTSNSSDYKKFSSLKLPFGNSEAQKIQWVSDLPFQANLQQGMVKIAAERIPFYWDKSCGVDLGTIFQNVKDLSFSQRKSFRNQIRSSFCNERGVGNPFQISIFISSHSDDAIEWLEEFLPVVLKSKELSTFDTEGSKFDGFEYWIIGDSPQLRRMHARIQNSEVNKRVVFLGEILSVKDVLVSSDLAVFPPGSTEVADLVRESVQCLVPFLAEGTVSNWTDLLPSFLSTQWNTVLSNATIDCRDMNEWIRRMSICVNSSFQLRRSLLNLSKSALSDQCQKDNLLDFLLN